MDNGLFGGGDSTRTSRSRREPEAAGPHDSHWDMVGPNFFSTAGISILYGREIGPQDSGNGQRVGLVNQTAARYFFGNANPIGRRIGVKTTLGPSDFVVIGVVADPNMVAFGKNHSDGSTFRSSILLGTRTTQISWPNFRRSSPAVSTIRAAVKQMAGNLPPMESKP